MLSRFYSTTVLIQKGLADGFLKTADAVIPETLSSAVDGHDVIITKKKTAVPDKYWFVQTL